MEKRRPNNINSLENGKDMVKRKRICKRNRQYTCLKAAEIVRPTVKNTEMEMEEGTARNYNKPLE